MAGYNQERNDKIPLYRRKELINNDNPSINFATGEIATSGSESQWQQMEFSRINYDYKGRYLLEMNALRRVSKFPAKEIVTIFPSDPSVANFRRNVLGTA